MKNHKQLAEEFRKESNNKANCECNKLFAQWLDKREEGEQNTTTHKLACVDAGFCVRFCKLRQSLKPKFQLPKEELKARQTVHGKCGYWNYDGLMRGVPQPKEECEHPEFDMCSKCGIKAEGKLCLKPKKMENKKVKVKFEMEDGKTLVFDAVETKSTK